MFFKNISTFKSYKVYQCVENFLYIHLILKFNISESCKFIGVFHFYVLPTLNKDFTKTSQRSYRKTN